jgi:translocation and assembly module TamA
MKDLATRVRCGRAGGASLLIGVLFAASQANAEVVLAGIEEPLTSNVLAHLNLDEEPCDAPRWRIEQQYQAAPARIRQGLEALGYYEPSIAPQLEETDACWRATFTIAAGEPTRIRNVDVALTGEATNDATFKEALDQAGLRANEVLDHGRYERLKRRWSDLGLERGYVDARFTTSRIDVYPPDKVADIVLHFDSGRRYYFGNVEFEQNVVTERLARAYVPFHPGDPYDARQLTALYVAYAESGYFETIDVRPLAADPERREIPIHVGLGGSRRRQISYGVGYSTDTGPRFRFGRYNPRFNDRGHQFTVSAQLSPVISELLANYRMPFGDPRTEWISFDTGIKREDTETSESESAEFGARRVYRRPGGWTRAHILTLLIEDFEVADQVGRSRLLMPGIAWSKMRADNSLRPVRGHKLDLEVRGAADQLASDTSFVQATARGKWIWSRPNLARFLVRGELGSTAESSFDELPASVRFFAGGDNSVRGYDFEALGPVDEDGEVVGGSSIVTGSFEYEHPVRARWSIAAFVDAGNAFASSDLEIKTGAGVGARWQSPLGPIRVDIAHPFDDETETWRLHISLGPDL